jgi:hypothetical protein
MMSRRFSDSSADQCRSERARQRARVADQIVADIEKRHQARLGRAVYAGFKQTLRAITTDEADEPEPQDQPGW